ncbi:serine/threonine-protein kinase [Nocardia cyriacigeorgica]|uniref:serine/threonine-protein kinase n=1 Tax=Nocardia cyriacigeorgica TaxID=135487 RepID=UPI0013D5BA80|nr:serine/threonine-protein kinase [Nocardia cyriacigeorgica]NEW28063.1 serine/threonine protein kinase [Nocardia cyriacigeorgica]
MSGRLTPGVVFAGYLIEGVLGSGGMGTVYLARHPRLPRREAVKVLSPHHSSDDEFRARFVREAELAARLDHPNVIAVHDRGVAEDLLWIAMQYVDGTDAAELIRRHPAGLAPSRVARIVTQAARGLDAAHRAGMLHRDVKPANLLIEARPGGDERVYVTDFGIARAAGSATALTESGVVVATLAYAAPEQLAARPVDQRADVYALGCTLFELLTGAKPFPRPTAAAVLHAHLQDPPPRATVVNPALPAAIDAVVARALAKDPGQRFPTCGALAAAVSAALLEPGSRSTAGAVDVSGAPPARPGATLPAQRRRRIGRAGMVAAALGSTLALAVIAGTIWAVGSQGDETSSAAAVSPSTNTVRASATAAAGGATWGSHDFVVRSFPQLLPATPDARGYQGLRCSAVDQDMRPVDVAAPVGRLARLSCSGNGAPVRRLTVDCLGNRSPNPVAPFSDMTVTGDQPWSRVSGSGRVIWGDVVSDGRTAGTLLIGFDLAGPGREHCQILVLGGSNGQELYDTWWPSVPV